MYGLRAVPFKTFDFFSSLFSRADNHRDPFINHSSWKRLLTPLSLGAKPTCPGAPWRDLQFRGPLLEMFFPSLRRDRNPARGQIAPGLLKPSPVSSGNQVRVVVTIRACFQKPHPVHCRL